ncbi:telomere length and silencing protein 1 homolog isoform X1 [Ctenocephalides felis]|uniref:telomere length and silencing protein 1 homolog isoform X1 n=1 Tax=Ctenocephalides felis TaxID=7515 RepID=UPI000E6E4902|nr:telomere length and silencing protein 1 homolog isoform X1 [Ctenocephalides felis]
MDSEKAPIVFKSTKKKPIRKRKDSSEDEESTEDNSSEINSKLEEMKELQKLRKRPNGVNVIGLALGQKISLAEEVTAKDPFSIKSGGMVNMANLKNCNLKSDDDAYNTGIGTQFFAETNKRDEDEEMMKYIEEQLSHRKGLAKKSGNDDCNSEEPNKYRTPEEAALLAVPDYLRQSTTQRSEEMLSNQMLSGIPEVDLGIEAKIKNIEATEEAKLKLLWEQRNKKDIPSQFVPTNMAVNFVQHNRFKIDEPDKKKRKQNESKEDTQNPNSKASDDFHFEKFKKQFRRY